jgi:hypothetical protein
MTKQQTDNKQTTAIGSLVAAVTEPVSRNRTNSAYFGIF